MPGNTFGKMFTVTTFGESHGEALGAVVDGCPPGLLLSETDFIKDLQRRKTGTSRYTSQRKEQDKIRILSGVFEGKTTGTPIGLLIENEDQRSKDYENIKDCFRPGHADFSYQKKYGIRDYRGGGRSSARETVMRVAAGVIAKKYLAEHYHMMIQGCLSQVGTLVLNCEDMSEANNNPLFCADKEKVAVLEDYIMQIRKQGESIGSRLKIMATGVIPGLGEPVFDKLNADIAHAMMSINAVKAVAIGDGFDCVTQKGSEHRDEITPEGFLSNHAGGILGGISTGQNIIVDIALKPASSILVPGKTINIKGEPLEVVTKGRHDPCVGIRAVPIAEAMLAIVLMDHLLRHRGQNSK